MHSSAFAGDSSPKNSFCITFHEITAIKVTSALHFMPAFVCLKVSCFALIAHFLPSLFQDPLEPRVYFCAGASTPASTLCE